MNVTDIESAADVVDGSVEGWEDAVCDVVDAIDMDWEV